MNIAVILTCHNRRTLTIQSLVSVKNAIDVYNGQNDDKVRYMIYLTDDGCTDGTIEAIYEVIPKDVFRVIKGDGNLFWAGGMRLAWKEAINNKSDWDFYLLLNDDTQMMPSAISELLEVHNYSLLKNGKPGLYSGICCDPMQKDKTTYGGNVWTSRFWGLSKRLKPIGVPQECDMTNANILLVSKEVVNCIGIFYDGYVHGKADYDYSIQAKQKGFSLYLTSNFCGYCSNDHDTEKSYKSKLLGMTLKQRLDFFKHPLHSNVDYLLFIKRNSTWRFPFVWLGRLLNVYFPHIYYKLRK